MRNIFTILKTDIRNICSHFFPLVIAVGLCALPALYAWFNIYANWDPYANTGNIRIAVASEDRGYQVSETETVNMGESIEDGLREATSIGWVFLDTEKEAVDGVNSGEYYAAIVIQPDFSESMYTALSDNFKNPKITYYENEKINAVGTKITDTAVDTLRKNINQQFIDVLTNKVFEKTNDMSKDMEENSAFDRFEENLKDINRNLKEYQVMVEAFVDSNVALERTVSEATGSMDGTRKKLETENGYMAKAAQDMNATNTSLVVFSQNVQNTMTAIESAINNMSTDIDQSGIAQDAATLDAQVNALKSDTTAAITHVNTLVKSLNDAAAAKAKDAASGNRAELEALSKQYQAELDANQTEINAKKQRISEIDTRIAEINKQMDELDPSSPEYAALLAEKTDLENEETGLEGDLNDLKKERADILVKKSAVDASLYATDPTTIDHAVSTAGKMLDILNSMQKTLSENITTNAAATAANEASAIAKNALTTCYQSVENVRNLYVTTLVPQMNTLMDSLQQVMDNVNDMLMTLDDALGDIDSVFDGLLDTVDSTNESLRQTAEVIKTVSDRLTEITDRLDAVAEDERAEELVSMLGGDPSVYGSFFSEPVVVNTNEIYPVINYGSAVTPFYTTLAIWVGTIFLTALFKVHADPTGLNRPTPAQLFLGRYLIFFILSQIQALIIVLGDLLFFKVQCLHPGMFWFASSVTAFVFSILIYSLAISFGDVGKALVVVMVVIQIAGSSGTFPIELLPDFYRRVYIFFPFPYAINAMRECIGGLYENTYGECLWELLIFAGVALFIGLVVRIPLMGLNRFIEERMEDTKIL